MVVLSHEGQAIGDVFATDEFIGIAVNFADWYLFDGAEPRGRRFLNRLRRTEATWRATPWRRPRPILPTDQPPV